MANKKLKVGNVPNLRFPGFEGEWEERKLGEMAEFKSGYAFKSQFMRSQKSSYQLIKMSNVYKNELRLDRNPSYWDNVDPKQRDFLLRKGDTVLTLTGTVGKRDFGYSVMIDEDNKYLLNQRLVLLRELKNVSCNGFINTIVSNETFLSQFFGEAKGGTGNQANVGIDDVKNIRINFPSFPEQIKIANFLTLIEQRLQTQNKIIEELNALKTAIAKRIFSQELKFKDDNGNNFPQWKAKRVGQVYSFKVTNSLSRESLNFQNGEVKNIHYGDIHTKFRTLFDITREEVPYINKRISLEKITEENYLKINDIIFADASEDLNDIGKSIEIVNLNNEKVLSGLHTILARPHPGTFSLGFGGYLFKSSEVKIQIQKEAQGSKVLSISSGRLSNVGILIPRLEEQTKIANVLSSLDSKIDVETQLSQQLEEQKTFLLQQMFF